MTERQDGEVVDLFTDGACSGNPGPGGWGVVMRRRGKEKELYGGCSATTNNRMELMAAIRGLEALNGGVRVNVHTDSRYLCDGITKWIVGWKRNGWKTAAKKPVKNVDLWRRLEAALEGKKAGWFWIKGHSGHPENDRADELARLGVAEVK